MKVINITGAYYYLNIKNAICIYKAYGCFFIKFIHNGLIHNPKYQAAYLNDPYLKCNTKSYFYNGNYYSGTKKSFKQFVRYQKMKIFK